MTRRRWVLLVISGLAHLILLIFLLRVRSPVPLDVTPASQFSVVFQQPSLSGAQAQPASAAPMVNLPPDEFGLSLPPPEAMQRPQPPPPKAQPMYPQVSSASPFAHVMNFSFGPKWNGSQSTYRGRGVAMGFAMPQPRPGPSGGSHSGFNFRQLSGPALGDDWFSQLQEWWAKHRRYPDEAARNRQDGMVALRLQIDPSGQVTRVELVGRSGSMYLDAGAEATFRDQKLPPFPPGSDSGPASLQISISYELIRG